MKMSEEFIEVVSAIHSLQQEAPVIQRSETADTGKFKYKYAGFSKVWDTVKPLLKKYDLTIMQPPSSGVNNVVGDYIETWVFHKSGQWIFNNMRLVITREDPQGMGSAISYARRYAMLSTLGLITDDDSDAMNNRLADGEMKKDWVRAFTIVSRKVNPDKVVTNADFINFMNDVYGKHPTKVLATEHQQVLDTINAFDN